MRVTETGPNKAAQGKWGVEDLRERPAPSATAGTLPVFRAAIRDDIVGQTGNRDYPANTVDTVYWNYWWSGYDSTVFTPSTVTEQGVTMVAYVTLLLDGLYGIRCTVDWEAISPVNLVTPFRTWLSSSNEAGGTEDLYVDPSGSVLSAWTLNQFRVVWPNADADNSVVIIETMHDNTVDDPLEIPGGTSGFHATPPLLEIIYFGAIDAPDDFLT